VERQIKELEQKKFDAEVEAAIIKKGEIDEAKRK
jgi:hypothetical protein